MSKLLPRVVYQMLIHGGYLVGSQAKRLVGDNLDETEQNTSASDFDVLVPFNKWQTITLLLPMDCKPNKFGGWRFQTDNHGEKVEVDVWPGSPMQYLAECKTKYGGSVYVVDYINNRVFSSKFQELDLDRMVTKHEIKKCKSEPKSLKNKIKESENKNNNLTKSQKYDIKKQINQSFNIILNNMNENDETMSNIFETQTNNIINSASNYLSLSRLSYDMDNPYNMYNLIGVITTELKYFYENPEQEKSIKHIIFKYLILYSQFIE